MTNGAISITPPLLVPVVLDSSGNISINTLPSNLDPGTQPAAPWNTAYRLDIMLTGAQEQTYNILVPPIQTETNATTTNTSNIVKLGTLTAEPWMIGQSITGSGIPSNTIIIGATNTSGSFPQQVTLNQITLSNNATATASGVSLTLGATVDLGYLLPTIAQPL